ncbi:MAG: gliding motility-associated C-terminal domain-containing protein [Bacteroidetes bacterium]|nr:MAG: gliding motility-associated C-terminal domain-containing protein [Bacteroidota bacterium]
MPKSKLILLLCFLFNLTLHGQILNGDFEEYSNCPTAASTPGDYQLNNCNNWYIPTKDATSDYFNSCSISTDVNVPSNVFGFQEPYSGEAYIGIGANLYSWGVLNQCFNGSYTTYYREYVQQAINGLEKDSVYRINFFISLADSVGGYAVKNIGLKFSGENLHAECFRPIVATPDIVSPDFVIESKDWVKVEGYYIAEGNEKYVTIGNFRDTLEFHLDTICTKPNTGWQDGTGQSYYYIDGVTIQKVSIPELPNIITPNNDGNNDAIDFSNYCITNENECSVVIINRWGNKVFDSDENGFLWSGKINNEDLHEGVYFYFFKIKNITKQGFISLIK